MQHLFQWKSYIWIGLTTMPPNLVHFRRQSEYLPKVRDLTQCWCIKTNDGSRYYCDEGNSDVSGERNFVGICDVWRDKISCDSPTKGDVLSISLTEHHSITAAYNGIAVTDVFHDLPKREMWVAVGFHERRIKAINPGKFR